MPLPNPQSLLHLFFDKLAARPECALVLDYDGTLAPFHLDRNQAVPFPGVRELLRQIMATGRTRVVLVSGRSPNEVRELLQIHPAPEIWGVHGQQRLWPDGHLDIAPLNPAIQRTVEEVNTWLDQHGYSNLVESKGGTVAVHFRGIPPERADAAKASILAEWEKLTESGHLSILHFDGGIELRPTEPNKGTAVTALLNEMAPGTPLAYLGDDTTDEDAFRALAGTGALTLLVRSEWRPTAAQAWLRPPEQLLDFLNEWALRTGRHHETA